MKDVRTSVMKIQILVFEELFKRIKSEIRKTGKKFIYLNILKDLLNRYSFV